MFSTTWAVCSAVLQYCYGLMVYRHILLWLCRIYNDLFLYVWDKNTSAFGSDIFFSFLSQFSTHFMLSSLGVLPFMEFWGQQYTWECLVICRKFINIHAFPKFQIFLKSGRIFWFGLVWFNLGCETLPHNFKGGLLWLNLVFHYS